jgi:transcriptional regulator with XRE-family HTH domain
LKEPEKVSGMQDMPIGERIRLYRRRRGLSQPRLAQLIGRSESWLSQVERGVRSVDRFSTIIELARVLRVQVVDLTGRPLSLAPNGGAHLDAVDALRRALMSYSAIPAALDMGEEPGRRPDLARLRRTVVMANELYQAGSYSGAGELLPGAIADAQEASRELFGDDRRAAFRVLAETYHITAKSLTKVSETELAWIAAERALAAAERAEEPLLVGASAYHIGHTFLRAGRNREATALTMEATTALAPSRDAGPERLALWGALHLTALFGAARGSDRRAADQLLNEAERAAERLGDERNDFWFAFGPTNVRIHAVALAVEVGDPDETIRLGESLDTSRLPAGVRGRRSAVLVDLARGYAMRRMDAAAVNTLLDAEQVAPEAVRYNLIVHELLRELLKREHRATTPQLRPLAERAGVLS